MNVLFFTQTTYGKKEEGIRESLIQRVNVLKTALTAIPGVKVKTSKIQEIASNNGYVQYRCDFYVIKPNREIEWCNVWNLVNVIDPCSYRLQDMSFNKVKNIRVPKWNKPITDKQAANLFFYKPAISQKLHSRFQLASVNLQAKNAVCAAMA